MIPENQDKPIDDQNRKLNCLCARGGKACLVADQGRPESPGEPRVCFINGGSDSDQRPPFRDSNNFLLLAVAP
jgi:hypothetical protein